MKKINAALESTDDICPDLIRQASSGWLAVTQKYAVFAILVTAATEHEMRETFSSVFNRLVALLNQKARKGRMERQRNPGPFRSFTPGFHFRFIRATARRPLPTGAR